MNICIRADLNVTKSKSSIWPFIPDSQEMKSHKSVLLSKDFFLLAALCRYPLFDCATAVLRVKQETEGWAGPKDEL